MSGRRRGRRSHLPGWAIRRVLAGPPLAAIVAGLLGGCGGSHPHRASTGSPRGSSTGAETTTASARLAVSPAHPTTRSSITFAYGAPAATGVHGKVQISYSLSVTGPAGSGCVGAHEAPGPSATQGQRVSVTVTPGQLGRPWCPGAYTARVFELQRAACTGTGPCPQYIRVVAIVAHSRFSVTAK